MNLQVKCQETLLKKTKHLLIFSSSIPFVINICLVNAFINSGSLLLLPACKRINKNHSSMISNRWELGKIKSLHQGNNNRWTTVKTIENLICLLYFIWGEEKGQWGKNMVYLNNKNNDLSFSTKNTEKINGRKEMRYDCGKITQITLRNDPSRRSLSL